MKRIILAVLVLMFLMTGVAQATDLTLLPMIQFFNNSGAVLNGGKLYFYESGTTTVKTVYQDAAGTTPHASPVVLDSSGRATVYLNGEYKLKITTSANATLKTIDPLSYSVSISTLGVEWSSNSIVPTYISASSFSTPGDYTSTFQVGIRLKSTNTVGSVYSTVTASSYSSPITTVTVINDSGSLDSGLSQVDTGVLTLTNPSAPITPTVTKTDDYPMTVTDVNKIFIFNKASAVAATLKAANTVPNGTWITFKNIGAGVLTLTGTVDGVANPRLQQYGEKTIYSNGTAWYENKPATAFNIAFTGEASAKNTSAQVLLDLGTVTAGDRIFVHAMGIITNYGAGNVGVTINKQAGTATIVFANDKTALVTKPILAASGSASYVSASGILQVTGSGTLTIQSDIGAVGGPTYDNQIYAFFLKKQ